MVWYLILMCWANPRIQASLCNNKAPCFIQESTRIGKDNNGDVLLVKIDLFAPLTEKEKKTEEDKEPFNWTCFKSEYHRVVVAKDKVVDTQYLSSECLYPNGSFPNIVIEKNRFIVDESPTPTAVSNLYTLIKMTWQLIPFQLIEEIKSEGHGLTGWTHTEKWNWLSMSGMLEWESPICSSEDKLTPLRKAIPIPVLSPQDNWKTSKVVASIDSSDTRGFIVHGSPDTASDATLKVAASSDGHIWVEVTDDILIMQKDKWVLSDHLEIWTPKSEGEDEWGMFCEEEWKAQQLGVMIDGTIKKGKNAVSTNSITTEVELQENTVRWKIKYSSLPSRITIVYSDTDDGKTQERLLSTSTVQYGKAHTLGSFFYIDKK